MKKTAAARKMIIARRVMPLAFVLVVIGYVLSRPAHAVSSNRELICGRQEHVHDANCYDEEQNLVCGQEEHIHNEACYGVVTDTGESGIVPEENAATENVVPSAAAVSSSSEKAEEKKEEDTHTYTAQGADYLVTAVVPKEAEIPEDAEFVVEEIPAGTERYQAYLEEAKAKMSAAGAFENANTQTTENGDAGEAAETAEAIASESVISNSWNVSGDSTGESVVTASSDGAVYAVTATSGENMSGSGDWENAGPAAEETGSEAELSNGEQPEGGEQSSTPAEPQVVLARFFDIRFMVNGEEIEPKVPVSVQISYTDKLQISENSEAKAGVIHFADHGTEVLKALTGKAQEDSKTLDLSEEQQNMLKTDAEKSAQDVTAVQNGETDEKTVNQDRITGIDRTEEVNTFAFAQTSFSVTGTIVTESITGAAQQSAQMNQLATSLTKSSGSSNVNTKNQNAIQIAADALMEDCDYIIYAKSSDEKSVNMIRALKSDSEKGEKATIEAALSSDGVSVYATGNDGANFDKSVIWRLKMTADGKTQLYNEEKGVYIAADGFPFSANSDSTVTITAEGYIIAANGHTYLQENGYYGVMSNEMYGTAFCFAEVGSGSEDKTSTIPCYGERVTRQEELKADEPYVLVRCENGKRYDVAVGDVANALNTETKEGKNAETKVFISHEVKISRDDRLMGFIDSDVWVYTSDGQLTNQSSKTKAYSNDMQVYLNRTGLEGQKMTISGSDAGKDSGFVFKIYCRFNQKDYGLKAFDNVQGAAGYNAYTAAKNYSFSDGNASSFELYHVVKYGYDVWFDATNGGNNFYIGGYSKNSTTHTVKRVTPQNGSTTAAVVLPGEDKVRTDSRYKTGYRLAGWYDTKQHKSYKPGETAYVNESTVFYASWMASNYNIGQARDLSPYSVYQPNITTSVFDYNEIFNMQSSYLLPSTYLTGLSHRESWSLLPGNDDFTFLYAQQNGMLVRAASRDAKNKSNYVSRNAGQYTGVVTEGIFNSWIAGTLFSQDSSHAQDGYQYIGSDHHLYSYDSSTGYYYYDSDLNAADYNQAAGRFYVHNYVNGTDKSNGKDKGDFLPFNSGSGTFKETNGEVNYWFGMKTEFGFSLPNQVSSEGNGNKAINGDPMVYKFSGDDDVWVFIDGKLALDLGGIHDRVYGEINFSNNTVTVGQAGATKIDAVRDGQGRLTQVIGVSGGTGVTTKKLTDLIGELGAGYHTLSFYYMERGASESDAAIYFNIAPSYRVDMTKKGDSGASLTGAEFKIYTDPELKKEAVNITPVPGSGTDVKYDENGGRTFVSNSPDFSLDGFVADTDYYICETKAPDGYQPLKAPATLKIFYEDGGQYGGFRARIYFNEYKDGKLVSNNNNTFNIDSNIIGSGGFGGYHIYIPNSIGHQLPNTGFVDWLLDYKWLVALCGFGVIAILVVLSGRIKTRAH
uniref:SpaA-like prealbumin fold domain-containing protein n=1 Tax=Eubacterium cellulosolvens (strain ATCC 43171 / JCM 9499 / 6) TaxID=633697 RepID=I5ATD7_EUBC6